MMAPLVVPVRRLPHAEGLPLPERQTPGSAGLDLVAATGLDEIITIDFCERTLVPTGLMLQLPQGFEAQVRPRSGLALKHGVTVLNSPGTVDADYRGEIKVLLVNLSREPFEIRRGLRIAQLVIARVEDAVLEAVLAVDATARGAGGFGSTGAGGA
ncbi:MAG: dUTP diphosphatase [Beijerinckiaceae bacterium]